MFWKPPLWPSLCCAILKVDKNPLGWLGGCAQLEPITHPTRWYFRYSEPQNFLPKYSWDHCQGLCWRIFQASSPESTNMLLQTGRRRWGLCQVSVKMVLWKWKQKWWVGPQELRRIYTWPLKGAGLLSFTQESLSWFSWKMRCLLFFFIGPEINMWKSVTVVVLVTLTCGIMYLASNFL